jgi:hypothetical protein
MQLSPIFNSLLPASAVNFYLLSQILSHVSADRSVTFYSRNLNMSK